MSMNEYKKVAKQLCDIKLIRISYNDFSESVRMLQFEFIQV